MTRPSSSSGVREVHATSNSFVSNRRNLWRCYTLAKTFNVLPSVALHLERRFDPLELFQFDAAVAFFGNWIEAQLEEAVESKDTRKSKRKLENKLMQLLQLPKQQKFKDPAELFGKKGPSV